MKLENDYAVIESLAELEYLFPAICMSIKKDMRFHKVISLINQGSITATKEQVKDKLLIKEEQDFFNFNKENLLKSFIRLPVYTTGFQSRYRKNKKAYMVPVNVLTINKSIQELYELGKFCRLWK